MPPPRDFVCWLNVLTVWPFRFLPVGGAVYNSVSMRPLDPLIAALFTQTSSLFLTAGQQLPQAQGWPAVLDVCMRVELAFVVSTWASTSPGQRIVWRLVAAAEEGGPRISQFVKCVLMQTAFY